MMSLISNNSMWQKVVKKISFKPNLGQMEKAQKIAYTLLLA